MDVTKYDKVLTHCKNLEWWRH